MRPRGELWARLGALTWEELPHRAREQVRRGVDRVRRPRVAVGELPRWPVELALTVPQFGGVWRQAEALVAQDPPDLERCPATGHRWGRGHAFDLDWFAGVDPRASWSQHRLRDEQLLAVAGAVGHDAADQACRRRVLGWIDTFPPLSGLGWAAGIEVACRAASLVLVASAAAGDWPPEERARLARSVAEHRWYLQRYPSVGSSANNHAVAELGARVLLGDAVVDAFAEAWLAQIRPDGSGVEEAPAYLAACVEWGLLVRATGRWSPALDARLAAAARFLGGLVDGWGRSPALGDDDGDAALAGSRERWVFEVAGLAASALGRPDLCPTGWMPGLRAALLGIGPCGGVREPRTGEVGGGVARLVAGDDVAWLDRGALGLPPMAAHGHADALSVVWHAAGRPLLVDTGTGTYLGDAAWRRHARGAAAHNGLVVDGRDPGRQRGPFQWDPEPDGPWEAVWLDAEANVAGGRWRGWGVLAHERSVRVHDHGLVIDDRLDGDGVVTVAFPFHLAPELVVEATADGFVVRDGASERARLVVEAPGLVGSIRLGGVGRVAAGWGRLVDAPCLWFEGAVALPWRGRFRWTRS